MIIDCVSDLHGHYPTMSYQYPNSGDLLIIAGDLTARHTYQEYILFKNWLVDQDYKKKVFIAGNHDALIQDTDLIQDVFYDCDYLCDSGTEFQGLKIWGSPWSLGFEGLNPKCAAFTGTEADLKAKFALIPSDTDILITHTPPFGLLDEIKEYCSENFGSNEGSGSLYAELYSGRIKPKLHVFGHIHEGYGSIPKMMDMPGVQFVNASHCNENYKPVNKPIRVIL